MPFHPGEGNSSHSGEGNLSHSGEGNTPSCSCPPCSPGVDGTRPHGTFPERVLFTQRFGAIPDLDLHAISQDHEELPLFDPDPCDDCCKCPTEAVQPSESQTKITWDDLMKEPESYVLCHLTREQQRILWHQRLGHLHYARIRKTSKTAKRVPEVTLNTDLEKCPVCMENKQRITARNVETSRRATQCLQGLSVDFGFMVQKSKNKTRLQELSGYNGAKCYLLITDHHSQMLYGKCFATKSAPWEFLDDWLNKISPIIDPIPDKYVRMDNGSELGLSHLVNDVFEKYGYNIERTAPNASVQNAPVERAHQTIADGIRTLLSGADIPTRFWPFAFHHVIRLYNITPHRGKRESPYEICSGNKPDLSRLRAFGCRVWILDDNKRKDGKAKPLSRTGYFLGFTETYKQIYYCDSEFGRVLTASHVVFDEAANDRDDKDRSPNAKMLRNATLGTRQDGDKIRFDVDPINLDAVESPWLKIEDLETELRFDYDSPDMEEYDFRPLGFTVADCRYMKRPFIHIDSTQDGAKLLHSPIGKTDANFRNKYKGAYLLKLGDVYVRDANHVNKILEDLREMPDETRPRTISMKVCCDYKVPKTAQAKKVGMRLPTISTRKIYMMNKLDPSGMTREEYLARIEHPLHPTDIPLDWYGKAPSPAEYLDEVILQLNRLEVQDMTAEERAVPKLTRSRLKKFSNWDTWDKCFDHEWDRHTATGLIGDPVPRPQSDTPGKQNIFRIVWNCHIKPEGTRKTRACLDGSKRAAPWLREQVNTYSACLEQPSMRLFFGLCARKNFVVSYGDSTNAFQNAPAPTHQCYLEIDESYALWYKRKHGKDINPRTHVIPLHKAMQGHPESGKLWADMVNSVLQDELGFIPAAHEPCLYKGNIGGKEVLVARMVDDYAIGSADTTAGDIICAAIDKRAATEHLGVGETTPNGAFARFNGVDVYQTRDYIKVAPTTYIERLLITHGWDVPSDKESDRHDITPMSYDKAARLLTLTGSPDGTPEHRKLEETHKFSYRQLLGEVLYAFVVGRLDIGYAVTLLARMAAAPHDEHFIALKKIVKYLRATKDWGVYYWRPEPNHAFPQVDPPKVPQESDLPSFPAVHSDLLTAFVDAAHAADPNTRRSITGFVVMYGGGPIAFKTKQQKAVTTSSTEAELIAAVSAAKVIRYLRSVLVDLGYPQEEPTIIHEDNQAVLDIVNKQIPSERTRHCDIQYFALQEWRARGLVKMNHIPGIINPADQATKAVGPTLHYRHVRRSMGFYPAPD